MKRKTLQTENVNYESGGGTRMDEETYHMIAKALLEGVPRDGEGMTLDELHDVVKSRIPGGELPGGRKIMWNLMAVKLDMEKKGQLIRVPKSKPQRILRSE